MGEITPEVGEEMNFDITAVRFGAYVQDTSSILMPAYSSYTEWHPCVYYRVRCVYSVYGEWVYLWTRQAAQEVGYTEDNGRSERQKRLRSWTL